MNGAKSGSDLPLPRWVLWLMVPGIVAPVVIFGFIVYTQLAHDPDRCPYRERSRKALGPAVTVVEEARSCMPSVAERRFTLLRGAQRQILGERRLRQSAFEAGYRWNASQGPGGEVKVVIHNDGFGELSFREGTARERASP